MEMKTTDPTVWPKADHTLNRKTTVNDVRYSVFMKAYHFLFPIPGLQL